MTLIPWAVTGGEDTQTPVCDGGGDITQTQERTLHKHRLFWNQQEAAAGKHLQAVSGQTHLRGGLTLCAAERRAPAPSMFPDKSHRSLHNGVSLCLEPGPTGVRFFSQELEVVVFFFPPPSYFRDIPSAAGNTGNILR